MTGASIAAGSLAGKQTQKVNSKKRVAILTWFMSTLTLEFTDGNTSVIAYPRSDPFECNATIYVNQLQMVRKVDALEGQPQRLTKLLAGTSKTIQRWSLANVIFEKQKLPIDLVFRVLSGYNEPAFAFGYFQS